MLRAHLFTLSDCSQDLCVYIPDSIVHFTWEYDYKNDRYMFCYQ